MDLLVKDRVFILEELLDFTNYFKLSKFSISKKHSKCTAKIVPTN